ASAQLHGLRHEVLTAAQAMRRFPEFRLPPDYIAVVQADGGFVEVEPSIAANLALAQASGGQVRSGETVQTIETHAGAARVVTDQECIETRTVVVTAGPWTRRLLPELPVQLRVTREVTAWFEPIEDISPRFPVFI